MNAAVGADERLVVMLEARVTEFEKRMRQAENRGTRTYQGLRRNSGTATRQMEQDMVRSTGRINQALASTTASIGTFGKAFLGGAIAGAATAAVAGLTSNLTRTVKAMASVGDEAKRAGVALDDFQRWKFVADQNRIGVDSLVDGFKELNLRADEFIVTGKGSAAEAFNRLNFSAEQLKDGLKDPSELMLEIVDRMQMLDQAGRIRVADEIFGGTGGERFVEMLSHGEAGIRRMMGEARILSQDQIDKAAELDRRYSALTSNLYVGWQKVALGAADFAAQVLNINQSIETLEASDLFRNAGQAGALLGDAVEGALEGSGQAVADHQTQIIELLTEYERFAAEATQLAPVLQTFSNELRRMGEDSAADALFEAAQGAMRLSEGLDAGEISADAFEAQMGQLIGTAQSAMSAIADIDNSRFNRVIERLAGLGGALDILRGKAAALRAALPGGADAPGEQFGPSIDGFNRYRDAVDSFTEAEQARNAATSEAIRLQREEQQVRQRAEDAGVTLTDAQIRDYATGAIAGEDIRREADRPDTNGAGGGGGSPARAGRGGKAKDEFADTIAKLREEKAALDAEAASLILVAESGQDYGDAMEYARTRAELLHAAQQAGKEITPQLTAEIDALAQGYVTAGLEAEAAAEKMKQIEEQTARGKSALEGMFGSIIDGSMSAKDAVGRLLTEIAKAQMLKGLMGLPGMGAASSALGGLLGFSSGGYTGNAPKDRVAGVVHGGEYVFSKRAVDRIGVGALESMHRGTRGFMNGGLVPGCEGGAEIQIERKSK